MHCVTAAVMGCCYSLSQVADVSSCCVVGVTAGSLFDHNPNCGSGPYLQAGLSTCVAEGTLRGNGSALFSFAVAGTAGTPAFSAQITLRTINGAARL